MMHQKHLQWTRIKNSLSKKVPSLSSKFIFSGIFYNFWQFYHSVSKQSHLRTCREWNNWESGLVRISTQLITSSKIIKIFFFFWRSHSLRNWLNITKNKDKIRIRLGTFFDNKLLILVHWKCFWCIVLCLGEIKAWYVKKDPL